MATLTQRLVSSLPSFFKASRPSPTKTLGQMGTSVSGGFIVSNERNSTLTGTQKYNQFSDILVNTSIAAASVRYFLNLVGRAGWRFEPSDHEMGQEVADKVQEAIEGLETPWSRVVRRVSMYRFHGFSVQEWTASRHKDGWLTLSDIQSRPQHTIYRWDLDLTGKVLGLIQLPPNDMREIYIPRGKVVYAVDDSLTDSPEGIGLLRACAEPARRLRRLEQLEGYAFEADLRGIPIARAPLEALDQMVTNGSITQAQRSTMLNSITNFMQTHIRTPNLGLLLDSATYRNRDEASSVSAVQKWSVDLMQSGSTMQADAFRTIERMNREVARIMGTEFLLLGGDGKGSQALSDDKSNAFFLTCDSTVRDVAQVVDKDVVQVLMDLNGWPQEAKPKVKTGDIEFKDVQAITAALKDMALAGAVLPPDDPAIDIIRSELGLPKSDPDSIRAATADATLLGPGNAPGSKKPGQESLNDSLNRRQ